MSETPKRAFGDAASDKTRGGTAIGKPRIEAGKNGAGGPDW
jgi:hypothetical protein